MKRIVVKIATNLKSWNDTLTGNFILNTDVNGKEIYETFNVRMAIVKGILKTVN